MTSVGRKGSPFRTPAGSSEPAEELEERRDEDEDEALVYLCEITRRPLLQELACEIRCLSGNTRLWERLRQGDPPSPSVETPTCHQDVFFHSFSLVPIGFLCFPLVHIGSYLLTFGTPWAWPLAPPTRKNTYELAPGSLVGVSGTLKHV